MADVAIILSLIAIAMAYIALQRTGGLKDLRQQMEHLTTKTEDEAVLGPDHPLRVERDPVTGEPSPYILIRSNLWALIDRKSFYRLIDLCCHHDHEGQRWFGLWSSGQFFPVIPSSELPNPEMP